MKTLHFTSHDGTIRNSQNVFKYLHINNYLDIENLSDISNFYMLNWNNIDVINDFWLKYQEKIKNYDCLFFSDLIIFSLPFILNLEKHNKQIVIYVTNRFDFMINDEDMRKQYANIFYNATKTTQVIFCSDNKYDQYYASLYDIHFFYNNIIRLTPYLHNNIIMPTQDKLFIYNQNEKWFQYYYPDLKYHQINFEVYGNGYKKYKDEVEIAEYLGFLHLPYQTNIQKLWENLGYYTIFFVPSNEFLKTLVNYDWYYFEEKFLNKNKRNGDNLLEKSIELSEWYQPENECYFEYFSCWEELKIKFESYKNNKFNIFKKKCIIKENIEKSNDVNIRKWARILKSTSQENIHLLIHESSSHTDSVIETSFVPNVTIVTAFYNIRKLENSIDQYNGRKEFEYLNYANDFILKLPYNLVIYIDDDASADGIFNYIQEKRFPQYKNQTNIIRQSFQKTYYFSYLERITQLREEYIILNRNYQHETPYYIILNNNKFHFLDEAIASNVFQSTHFMWLDFGINHVAKNHELLHQWIKRIPDKIKQMCLNPYIEDDSPKEFFTFIYHHLAGGLFSGNKENMLEYINLFKKKNEQLYDDGWYQIDEAVMTMIQRENNHLFELYYGDYQGIISNYEIPQHNIDLIIQGLIKTFNSQKWDFSCHIINYLSPYFLIQENQMSELFYTFISIFILIVRENIMNTGFGQIICQKIADGDPNMGQIMREYLPTIALQN
jgi:hypothetical protein